MRISVLAGLFACAVIFGLNTSQAEASTPVNVLEIHQSETAVDTILAVAEPVNQDVVEPAEPATSEEPAQLTHVVQENETLSTIATLYSMDWQRLYDKNTELQNPNVISTGDELLIPSEEEQLERREFVAPEPAPAPARQTASATTQPAAAPAAIPRGNIAGNGYVAGYCTWYAKSRRPDLPNNLGNAINWVSRAAAQGFATGSTPQAGAIAQRGNHVGYVEAVNGDGTMVISDMNHRALYQITTRTVPASEWRYIY